MEGNGRENLKKVGQTGPLSPTFKTTCDVNEYCAFYWNMPKVPNRIGVAILNWNWRIPCPQNKYPQRNANITTKELIPGP